MTISRSNLLFLAISLIVGAGDPARGGTSEVKGAWEAYKSESEGIWKLLFLPAGSNHGDIYLRCRPGDNWVFLIEDAPPNPEGKLVIQVGNTRIEPSAQIVAGEDGSYTEGVFPLGSPFLQSLPGASSFTVNSSIYPISSLKDRTAISDFLSGCRGR